MSTLANNKKTIEGTDLIILAVKPQDLAQVMEEILKAENLQIGRASCRERV